MYLAGSGSALPQVNTSDTAFLHPASDGDAMRRENMFHNGDVCDEDGRDENDDDSWSLSDGKSYP